MKKTLILILCAALLVCLLGACGTKPAQPAESAAPETAAPATPEVTPQVPVEDREESPSAAATEAPAETPAVEPTATQSPEESAAAVAEKTDGGATTYEQFLALTPNEQDAFMQSFESMDAFTAWLVAAQEAYTAGMDIEEIGVDGVISIGGRG